MLPELFDRPVLRATGDATRHSFAEVVKEPRDVVYDHCDLGSDTGPLRALPSTSETTERIAQDCSEVIGRCRGSHRRDSPDTTPSVHDGAVTLMRLLLRHAHHSLCRLPAWFHAT